MAVEEDYPRTLLEFETRFATEEACRDYLFKLRWPEGFVCPACGGRMAWPATRGRWVCRNCQRQTTVTAGTIFQDTHKPLRLWFRVMWHVTSQKTGASALGLQRELGLQSYVTPWTWLHKLRRAMVRPGRDRLRGRVEVDESFVGGEEPGFEGRSAPEKSLVAIAAEEEGRGIGRIRLARIPDARKPTLHGFIRQAIEPGSVVHTDGWTSYEGLGETGYRHQATPLRGQPPSFAVAALPRVHRVSSLLKRWLLGTHHGAVRPEHLDYYLDEFTFRFNRRKSHSRGKLFYRLAQQAAEVAPAPYHAIIGGRANPNL